MDLMEIGWGVLSGFIWLRILTVGGLLWMRWWTFGFWRHGVSYVQKAGGGNAVQLLLRPSIEFCRAETNTSKIF
jgi:hypothetical protein